MIVAWRRAVPFNGSDVAPAARSGASVLAAFTSATVALVNGITSIPASLLAIGETAALTRCPCPSSRMVWRRSEMSNKCESFDSASARCTDERRTNSAR
jgi:hypothetical protein